MAQRETLRGTAILVTNTFIVGSWWCMQCAGLGEIVDLRDKAVVISCMHVFCLACLSRWSALKKSCPLCKVMRIPVLPLCHLSFKHGCIARSDAAMPILLQHASIIGAEGGFCYMLAAPHTRLHAQHHV